MELFLWLMLKVGSFAKLWYLTNITLKINWETSKSFNIIINIIIIIE